MRLLNNLLVFGVLISLNHAVYAQSVNIDLKTEYQKISGFGGISHTTWIPDLNIDQREKAFSNKPGELGLSILRIHVDPDTSNFKLEIPTALFAKEKGVVVFGSPWNAPASITELYNGSNNRVKYDKYNEYTYHLNSFIDYMNNNGVPLYAISIQNEPDYGDWTRWTSSEMLTFMKQNAQSLKTKVMAPESFQFIRQFTDPILNDSTACAHLSIVAGHIYGGGLFDYPLAREKGKEVWMTEHYTESSNSANAWPLALDVATEITNCMKANFNAYIWWYIRRFYGFIDDAGNITKRGYIMSQFSKFIRPGYTRVGATATSAPNIDVTAYKTDSSYVIVVVNRGTASVNLNFNIQNGTISSLTKYTTSAVKNVVNDGLITITGGTFNSSVDASSITTFSSYAGNAGNSGNLVPLADAGQDISVTDNDNNGIEKIIFNGSGTDNNGTITKYSWSENGKQVAWVKSPEIDVPTGNHVYVLTITDNDGATAKDTVYVNVKSLYNTNLWFEAECGQKNLTDWNVLADAGASNGLYATVKAGTESTANAASDSIDYLKFNFNITEPGIYKLWGRVITPTANDDSYWVKMDTGKWINWNSIPATTTWAWDDVHDQAAANTVTYSLGEGSHTILICFREDGAKIDKLYLTNTGSTPSGKGDIADNCGNNEAPVAEAGLDQNINTSSSSVNVNVDATQSTDKDGIIVNYSWKEGNKVLASTAKASINLSAGVHKLYLIVCDNFGATDIDSITITVLNNTIISSVNTEGIYVYPNPVEDLLYIVNSQNYKYLIIRNLAGQVVLSEALNENKKTAINTSGLKGGVYIVRLIDNNNTTVLKIIKK